MEVSEDIAAFLRLAVDGRIRVEGQGARLPKTYLIAFHKGLCGFPQRDSQGIQVDLTEDGIRVLGTLK